MLLELKSASSILAPSPEDQVQVGKASGHISVYMFFLKKKSMCCITKNRCDSSVTCQAEGNPNSCHISHNINNKQKGEGRASHLQAVARLLSAL